MHDTKRVTNVTRRFLLFRLLFDMLDWVTMKLRKERHENEKRKKQAFDCDMLIGGICRVDGIGSSG